MGLVYVFRVEIDQGRGIKIRFPRSCWVFFENQATDVSMQFKNKVAIRGDLLPDCLLKVTKIIFLSSENRK